MSDRPKLGPADPETRRRMLRETLDREAAEGAERRARKARDKKNSRSSGGLSDALNPKIKRERRYGERGETLDEIVDRAVTGAKLPY